MDRKSPITDNADDLPALVSVFRASRVLGIHRDKVAYMVRNGHLRSIYVRKRWLILRFSLLDLLGANSAKGGNSRQKEGFRVG